MDPAASLTEALGLEARGSVALRALTLRPLPQCGVPHMANTVLEGVEEGAERRSHGVCRIDSFNFHHAFFVMFLNF